MSSGGARPGAGRKPKPKKSTAPSDPAFQDAFAQAIPPEKWGAILSTLADIATQQDDKRAAILAARELRQFRAYEHTIAQTKQNLDSHNQGPQPFDIIYEDYNDLSIYPHPDTAPAETTSAVSQQPPHIEPARRTEKSTPQPIPLHPRPGGDPERQDVIHPPVAVKTNAGMRPWRLPRRWTNPAAPRQKINSGIYQNLLPYLAARRLSPEPGTRPDDPRYGRAGTV